MSDNKPPDMDEVKGRSRPRGGVPPVRIPPLGAQPILGENDEPLSMSEQAAILTDPTNPLSPMYDPSAAAAHPPPPQGSPRPPAARTRQPLTVLPEAARSQPGFRPGAGAMVSGNQPDLQSGRAQSGILSPETSDGLHALANFQEAAEAHQKKVVDDARAAQRSDPVREMLAQAGIEDEDLLEQFKNEMASNKLANAALRKAIELRCTPLDFDQLMEDGEARQAVEIRRTTQKVKGLSVVFRTISAGENLELRRMMFNDLYGEAYVREKFSILQLAAGLFSINERPLPTHLKEGYFDADLFSEKLKMVMRYPVVMMASLSINYSWFHDRTEDLFVDMGEVKNG